MVVVSLHRRVRVSRGGHLACARMCYLRPCGRGVCMCVRAETWWPHRASTVVSGDEVLFVIDCNRKCVRLVPYLLLFRNQSLISIRFRSIQSVHRCRPACALPLWGAWACARACERQGAGSLCEELVQKRDKKLKPRTSAPSTRLRHGARARRPRAHSQR